MSYYQNQQINPAALQQELQRVQQAYNNELARIQQIANQAKQVYSNPFQQYPPQQPINAQPQATEQPQEIPPHVQQLQVLGEIKELLLENNKLMKNFTGASNCTCETNEKITTKKTKNESD